MLQVAVSDYLNLQYPKVIFTSESSGGKAANQQAAIRAKRKRSQNGLPDLIILKRTDHYAGLMLELKVEKTCIIVKIGERKGMLSEDKHIVEQYNVLESLRKEGYYAEFAVGFDQAKAIIDAYMGNQIVPRYHEPTNHDEQ